MYRRAGLLLVLSLLAACSEPPTKERDQADAAIASARAAEAPIWAKTEFSAATAARQKYDEAVAQRDYKLALNYALQASDSAYAAARLAPEQKTAVRKSAEKLVSDLDGWLKVATGRLTGTAPRLTADATVRVRATQRAAAPALHEARVLLSKQAYAEVVTRLTPFVDALQRELAPPETGRRGRSSH